MVYSRGESLTHHTNQMKLLNVIAAAAVLGASLLAIGNAAKANACYPSLIVDDMNMLVMEGKSVQQAWQEQVRLGNSDGSDYCWRRTQSYLRLYAPIKRALYTAIYK